MDLEFDQEQLMLRDTIQSFIRREYPEETVRQMCIDRMGLSAFSEKLTELGITGICFPEQYGGAELGPVEMAIVIEELSRYSIDFGMSFGAGLAAGLSLLHHGDEHSRNRYLPELIGGRLKVCFAYTEPFVFGTPCKAKVTGENGSEQWKIRTGTVYSEMIEPGSGIILMPVETGDQLQVTILPLNILTGGEQVAILGRELSGQIKYPPQTIKGSIEPVFDQGTIVMESLTNYLKFFNVISCAGNMRTVVEKTVQYAKEREQFGQPIGKFQAIQHMIVDAKTGLDCSVLYGHWLAWLLEKNGGKSAGLTREITMANTFVAQAYMNAVNTGIQVMGGFGYMAESHMERYARDARMAGFHIEDSYSQKIKVADGSDFSWI